MKTYKVGDSIYFRDDDTTPTWGIVHEVRYKADNIVRDYVVNVQGDSWTLRGVRVSLGQIIDLEEVSARASAAIERIRRQTEARAALLDYLLGELQAYADRDGDIRYTANIGGIGPQKARHSLREIVDRYVAKRQATYGA